MIEIEAYDKTIIKDITFIPSSAPNKEIHLNTGRFPVKLKYFDTFFLDLSVVDCNVEYSVKVVDNLGNEFESLTVAKGERVSITFPQDKLENYPEEIIYTATIVNLDTSSDIVTKKLNIYKPTFRLKAKFMDDDISGDISRYSYRIRSIKDNVFSDFVDVIEDSVS